MKVRYLIYSVISIVVAILTVRLTSNLDSKDFSSNNSSAAITLSDGESRLPNQLPFDKYTTRANSIFTNSTSGSQFNGCAGNNNSSYTESGVPIRFVFNGEQAVCYNEGILMFIIPLIFDIAIYALVYGFIIILFVKIRSSKKKKK